MEPEENSVNPIPLMNTTSMIPKRSHRAHTHPARARAAGRSATRACWSSSSTWPACRDRSAPSSRTC